MRHATQVRGAILVVAVVWPFLLEAPVLLQAGLQAVGFALLGLALLVATGWMRVLALHIPMAAGLGALACARLLAGGQGLPVALVAAALVGVAAGAVVVTPVLRDPRRGLPVVSLLATFAVWAVVLPSVRVPGFPRPVVLGIDLAGDRPLYLAVVVIGALAWFVVDNLDRAALGRRLRVLGGSPDLLIRSGVDPAATWVSGMAVVGGLAGTAGAVLALGSQSMPDVALFSPTYAVVLLAIPLLAAVRSSAGVLVGAVVLVAAARVVPLPAAQVAVGAALVAGLALLGGRGLPGLVQWWRSA